MRKLAENMPERRCIYTGTTAPRDFLIRFAVSPDGEIVPDLEEKLPGRGLWLTASADIVRRACAENVFSRVARRNLSVPVDMVDRLIVLLDRRCLDLIALARRSGAAVAGFEKVRQALAVGGVALLVEATDGASDGREKIGRKASGIETLSLWSANQIGGPFGRDRVVHVAVLFGGLAKQLIRDGRRLEGLQREVATTGARLKLQES
ncbi:MAG: RNA-binding protein [Pseudomonadota bacterium]|nr:RNA-binding protein [Pseudomonadota bacterium]